MLLLPSPLPSLSDEHLGNPMLASVDLSEPVSEELLCILKNYYVYLKDLEIHQEHEEQEQDLDLYERFELHDHLDQMHTEDELERKTYQHFSQLFSLPFCSFLCISATAFFASASFLAAVFLLSTS
jgi:hypothetical protein